MRRESSFVNNIGITDVADIDNGGGIGDAQSSIRRYFAVRALKPFVHFCRHYSTRDFQIYETIIWRSKYGGEGNYAEYMLCLTRNEEKKARISCVAPNREMMSEEVICFNNT